MIFDVALSVLDVRWISLDDD